ncbi:hypothetical protein LO771_22325 [Streptacidiphilus sp. ASG 303]|uniref:hypothetical protein n=1 Tax=Streptacidiphilus sp. ASG 303 TaxID=2896847 RepID=UPI001E50B2FA|nr:hypothetical protein [Streptacidiphilus sp. ASG 303]MCD0485044.1 hypothetical protein [Streptacidiphilus sp. ASG 303]
MAPAPHDRRAVTGQARVMAFVTLACLVLVSLYSAVLRSEPGLWLAWSVLAAVTGALLVRARRT